MRASVLCIASLLAAAATALTITSPSDGQVLDPTEPITFSWTSTSSDPSTFDIVLDNSESGGLTSNVKVASDVSASSGKYILPANIASSYGEGFVLRAESTGGDVLATSPSFTLSMGSATTVDGQISYISTHTYTGTVSEGPASITDATATQLTTTGDSTVTDTGNIQATLGQISDSSTTGGTASATGSSSFTTSTVSRSGSSTDSSSSSSASATSSQNAQPKLASGSQIAFTAAGLMAGLAALLA